MTATIYFIRHARHGHYGKTLSGRQPDIPLTEAGQAEAAALAAKLAGRLTAVHSSPVLRARQTAGHLGAEVEEVDALDEIDFGDWTGRDFTALDGDLRWRAWNERRGAGRAPGGESMAEAQARIVGHADRVARDHPDGHVALVSHCDLIRGAIAHYLGLPLDNLLRFAVDPASVSRVRGGEVLSVNETLQ